MNMQTIRNTFLLLVAGACGSGTLVPLVATLAAASAAAQNQQMIPPSGVQAIINTAYPHGVRVSWIDNTTNENGFEVWRRPAYSAIWTKVKSPGVNATSVSFGNPSAGGYYYKVRARRYLPLTQLWIYSSWSPQVYVVLQ